MMVPRIYTIVCALILIKHGFPISLNKCCPDGKLLDLHTKECVDDNLAGERKQSIVVPSLSRDFSTITQKEVNLTSTNSSQQFSKCVLSQRRNLKKYSLVIVSNDVGVSVNVYGHRGGEIFNTFCVDRNDQDDEAVIQVCDDCASTLCLSFCCGEGKYTLDGQCKVGDTTSWDENFPEEYNRVHSDLHCKQTNKLKYPKSLYEVKNNQLFVDNIAREHSEYCINNVKKHGEYVSDVLLCPKIDNTNKTGRLEVKKVLLIFSEVSIFIVLFFHCLIAEFRRSHFAKMKMFFLSCLFVTFFILIISAFKDFKEISQAACTCIGLFLQYFGLATFFWLTCMSFDIWLTFRKLNDPTDNIQEKQRIRSILNKTFFLFSFLGPLFIMLLTASLQTVEISEFSKESTAKNTYIHPSIGEPSCFLKQEKPAFFYFYLIIIALLSLNIVFYGLLVYAFFWGVWASNRNFNIKRDNMKICLELLIIMGLNWVTEFINFMVIWLAPRYFNHWATWACDIFNWLTGVFILLAFITKSSNQKHLKAYFGCLEQTGMSNSHQLDSYRSRSQLYPRTRAISQASSASQITMTSHLNVSPQNSFPGVIEEPDSPSNSIKSDNSGKIISTITSLESASSGIGSIASDAGPEI